MQHLLEHFGVTVAALTGVLGARGKQIDLFGVIVIAMVTAFGGGTVRDILLVEPPVFWVADPAFVANAFLTALATFYLVRWHELPASILLVADAFALAFFTMLGARKGLVFGVAPTIAIAMGVITGVAGGVFRDLLLGQLPLVFQRETYLYATAAFFGAILYVALIQVPGDRQVALIVGTAATLLLRLAGIRWRIALPMFRPKNTIAAADMTKS